jgi:hypothetical protein
LATISGLSAWRLVFSPMSVVQIVELRVGQTFLAWAAGPWIAPAAGTGAEFEFPVAFPNGEAAVDGVMNDALAHRLARLTEQGREEAEAVLSGVVGKFDACDFSERWP